MYLSKYYNIIYKVYKWPQKAKCPTSSATRSHLGHVCVFICVYTDVCICICIYIYIYT